jgi:hypothetical protein
MAPILGIHPGLLAIILVWSLVWEGIALWKSARNNHLFWFILFLLVHILGIPEIIYIIVTKDKKRKR